MGEGVNASRGRAGFKGEEGRRWGGLLRAGQELINTIVEKEAVSKNVYLAKMLNEHNI